MLGHWLKRFIYLTYHRYYSVRNVIKNKKINKVYLVDTNKFQLATEDTSGIAHASLNDKWNNKLYMHILKHLRFNNIVEISSSNKNKKLKYKTILEIEKVKKNKLKFKIFNLLVSFFSFFFKKKKIYIL